MATMGRYCKAYAIDQFRKFKGWEEKIENLAPIENDEDGSQQPRTSLAEDDYLFLQENYVVTDGIFLDEHIVFDSVTPEWKEFCTNDLALRSPTTSGSRRRSRWVMRWLRPLRSPPRPSAPASPRRCNSQSYVGRVSSRLLKFAGA